MGGSVARRTLRPHEENPPLPAGRGGRGATPHPAYVFGRPNGRAAYGLGRWSRNAARAQRFHSPPLARNNVWRYPRFESIPATKTLTGLGAIGLYVNGVSL